MITEYEKSMLELQESNLANSLGLGASWLESVSNGDDVRSDTLRMVAAGMRDKVADCNTNISRLTGNLICSCFNYLRSGEEDKDWWLGQIKKWSDELKSSESKTINGIISGGVKN